MLLADLGADVVRVDRPGGWVDIIPSEHDLFNRGKRSLCLDFKSRNDIALMLSLVEKADVIVEGFRPGVAEKLGFGPEECFERNSKIIYGRMTGWGQDGPLARNSGHDINYIALSGPLHTIGPAGGPPQPPLALVGDCPGALYLTVGLLSALFESRNSGKGQIVDAAIVDTSAHMMTFCHIFWASGMWRDERGVNLIDGGAPFYSTYRTSDGMYMAVGAMEQEFFEEFTRLLELDVGPDVDRADPETWPFLRERIAKIFASKTQKEWERIFDGTDACVTPVLGLEASVVHPHNVARNTFVEFDGVLQPAPAPRFSRTQASLRSGPYRRGQHDYDVIEDWLGKMPERFDR